MTRSNAEDVSAVVLNHATGERTLVAVRSLQDSRTPPGRIVVVDNGSPDGSGAWLRGRLPDVEILQTGVNLGFAGGCNAGIERALVGGARWVLLVNSDAILAADALDVLLRAAAAHPSAAILGPLVVRSDEPGRVDSSGIRFDARTGRMRHLEHGADVTALEGRLPLEVDAVMGCAMLIARAVLERAGLLDASYFFSFEDIELCLRARRFGFVTLSVPAARVLHHGQGTIGARSPRRAYFAARNHLRLADAGGGSRRERAGRAVRVLALNAAHAVRSPDLPSLRSLGAIVRGAWHHARGRYGAD